MKKKAFRFLLVITLILPAFAFTTTALAAGPDIEKFHEEGSFIAADCGSFLALEEYVQDVRVTTFFDNDSNPVSVQVEVNFNGIITNSMTGVTVRDHSHIMIVDDLQSGSRTIVGLAWGITVPGQGIVVQDIGKVVLDEEGNPTFESGPHHQILHGGEVMICAALVTQ